MPHRHFEVPNRIGRPLRLGAVVWPPAVLPVDVPRRRPQEFYLALVERRPHLRVGCQRAHGLDEIMHLGALALQLAEVHLMLRPQLLH